MLTNVEFLLGDAVSYLETNRTNFDVIMASGILYHLTEPVRFLDLICQRTNRIFLWTHYFDPEIVRQSEKMLQKFEAEPLIIDDYKHYRYHYQEALKWEGFCGGNFPSSYWLTLDDILVILDKNGFNDIKRAFHAPITQMDPLSPYLLPGPNNLEF